MAAAVDLLQKVQADVVQCLVVMELKDLNGKDKVSVPVHSLITYCD